MLYCDRCKARTLVEIVQTVTPWKIKLDILGKGKLKESEFKRD